MKRTELVQHGYAILATAEDSVDTALGDTAILAAELGRLRRTARLSLVLGQEAVDEVVEAVAKLNDARRALVRAHGRLSDVKDRVAPGAATLAGTLGDKGDSGDALTPPSGSIKRVA